MTMQTNVLLWWTPSSTGKYATRWCPVGGLGVTQSAWKSLLNRISDGVLFLNQRLLFWRILCLKKKKFNFFHNLSPVCRQGFVQPFQHACRLNFLHYIDSLWSPSPHTCIYSLIFLSFKVLYQSCFCFCSLFFFFPSVENCVLSVFLRQQESLLSSQPGVGTWWREAIWTTTSTGLKASSVRRFVHVWPATVDVIPVVDPLVTNHRFSAHLLNIFFFWFNFWNVSN